MWPVVVPSVPLMDTEKMPLAFRRAIRLGTDFDLIAERDANVIPLAGRRGRIAHGDPRHDHGVTLEARRHRRVALGVIGDGVAVRALEGSLTPAGERKQSEPKSEKSKDCRSAHRVPPQDRRLPRP